MHALTLTHTSTTPLAIPSAPTPSALETKTAEVGLPIVRSKPRSYSEVGRQPSVSHSPLQTHPFSLDPSYLIVGSAPKPSPAHSPIYREPEPVAEEPQETTEANHMDEEEEEIQFEFDDLELNLSPPKNSVLSPESVQE